MNPSIILSTYNNPEWLEKVLWGFQQQIYKDFEIVIADDGSGKPTQELIERFQKETDLTIQHVWHEDDGFQKCKILNLAILASKGDYLIFVDGDCIPREDFVQTHVEQAKENYFLSGGACKLSMELSNQITQKDISSGRVFDITWLESQGFNNFSNKLKLGLGSPWNTIADTITTTKPTWNGGNASTWKKHIIEVNGHNEDMQYGGEDRELGLRLLNLGLKAKQLRHRAILVHLEHSRGYVNQEALDKNMAIRKETIASGRTWTDQGINKK